MVISHTQEFPDETLSQDVVTNIFHLSNQDYLKKEKPALTENKGLTRILEKLLKEDIPGKNHIERYVRDQYGHNLRLSTIKGSLTGITSFLVLVKQSLKKCLEEITRGDLGAFNGVSE